tara:strand:- start:8537 stop:10846 length:2310 start_codon:yes stop_codon:yes gene_type:complete
MNDSNLNNFTSEMSLADYITILRIHLFKIICIVVLGFVLAIYFTFTTHPVFESTSSVIVKDKPGTGMVMNFGASVKNKMTNEIQLIKSRKVAKEVVRRLWNSPDRNTLSIFGTRKYYPKGERLRRIIKELMTLGLYDPLLDIPFNYESDYSDEIGNKFSSNIIRNTKVLNSDGTDVIKITFQSVFSEEARKIADMIAFVYKDMEKVIGNENAKMTVEFIEDLVHKQEKSLIIAEEILKNFKIENNIYNFDGDASLITNQVSTIESEIYNSLSEVNIAKEKILFFESKLSNDEKSLALKISSDINAQMIVLRGEITQLESQLIQNNMMYGKGHLLAVELKEKLRSLKSQLDKNVDILISQGVTVSDPLAERQEIIISLLSLESEIFGLELKVEEAKKLREIYNDKLLKLPDKQLEFARFGRDVNVLTQNYSLLRQKLEEAKIKLVSQTGKVQLLDAARKSSKPLTPNHRSDILQGIIISVFLSFGIIFLLEFFDNSIRTMGDIENLGLTVLGVIPAISGDLDKKYSFLKLRKNNRPNKALKRRLITREDPRSPISEAYRSLRTSMLYTDIDEETKSILVSSAGPGEGKTTTVANMAITYANLGKKTLLIDTDLRRPVVHKVFDLNKEPGITNYLAGATDDFESLIKPTEIDNLSAVTSGIIPPNPSELLGSKRMTQLVKNLEKKWDIILFDSPPLVAVTDATMVSKEIDKIIIVVKVNQTDKRAFKHTIQSLRNINAPLGGVVLNAVTHKSSYGYYYYYYQYYNYYGSEK